MMAQPADAACFHQEDEPISQLSLTGSMAEYTPRAQEWLGEVLDALNQLLFLQDNWNSYGASAPRRDSIDLARDWAARIANHRRLDLTESEDAAIATPTVSASADGNAVLCWYRGEDSLELEVLPTGFVDYVLLDGEQDLEGQSAQPAIIINVLVQSFLCPC